ncbi:hypothetical protein H7X46_00395 [Pseudonocardia sp. C8]|uniref:hypothetical protein n=1 Tax=Pseudonocardia sp. C8 TaxID=2762759 RepID=UPI001642710E|nr:hypothetical protein [Pseudonocardia sp. C8]MBC3189528.1 hypothetical protein [Pseudonocardia sp. C8]
MVALVALVWGVISLVGLFSDAPGPAGPGPGPSAPGVAGAGSGAAIEAALARAPMPPVPAQASMPHALSMRSAGAPITLPQPSRVAGTAVPIGFPAGEEGALAQVAELTKVGMAGADPQVWAQAYAALAEPGAAPPDQTPLHRELVALRRSANMPVTGTRDGMRLSWSPTAAMVKGRTDDGSYVVACVLGELVADYQGRVVNAGWGNCLPMRRVGDQWRVASGPAAWAAPAPWPGSDEAVAVGYRDIVR